MVTDYPGMDDAHRERMYRATDMAQEAFWACVAAAFPEAEAGDFPPDAHMHFEQACRHAVFTWLQFNFPAPDNPTKFVVTLTDDAPTPWVAAVIENGLAAMAGDDPDVKMVTVERAESE